jgi:hypothetical protein
MEGASSILQSVKSRNLDCVRLSHPKTSAPLARCSKRRVELSLRRPKVMKDGERLTAQFSPGYGHAHDVKRPMTAVQGLRSLSVRDLMTAGDPKRNLRAAVAPPESSRSTSRVKAER